jgi:tRNA (guanine9-N1)-methyltransferase
MADNDDTPTVDPPVSKNAMKKAAKAQYYAEKKTERRLHEKEQKKQKKRQLAERQAAGELDEEDEVKIERMIKRRKLGREVKDFWPGKIVIDLGFDDKMSEKVCMKLSL